LEEKTDQLEQLCLQCTVNSYEVHTRDVHDGATATAAAPLRLWRCRRGSGRFPK
jgi:hypothetical protein